MIIQPDWMLDISWHHPLALPRTARHQLENSEDELPISKAEVSSPGDAQC